MQIHVNIIAKALKSFLVAKLSVHFTNDKINTKIKFLNLSSHI